MFDVHISRMNSPKFGADLLLLVVVERLSALVVGLFTAEAAGQHEYRVVGKRPVAYRRVAEIALRGLSSAEFNFAVPVQVHVPQARL
jgi:hypothetical protein